VRGTRADRASETAYFDAVSSHTDPNPTHFTTYSVLYQEFCNSGTAMAAPDPFPVGAESFRAHLAATRQTRRALRHATPPPRKHHFDAVYFTLVGVMRHFLSEIALRE